MVELISPMLVILALIHQFQKRLDQFREADVAANLLAAFTDIFTVFSITPKLRLQWCRS